MLKVIEPQHFVPPVTALIPDDLADTRVHSHTVDGACGSGAQKARRIRFVEKPFTNTAGVCVRVCVTSLCEREGVYACCGQHRAHERRGAHEPQRGA